MLFPFTYEGIGPALKSGILAAEAVIEALAGDTKADRPYLRKAEEIKLFLKELESLHKDMDNIAKRGARALSEAMGAFIEKTL
jgi:flavin-dependent dehydrogenase